MRVYFATTETNFVVLSNNTTSHYNYNNLRKLDRWLIGYRGYNSINNRDQSVRLIAII